MKSSQSKRNSFRRIFPNGKTRRFSAISALFVLVVLWLVGIAYWHFGSTSYSTSPEAKSTVQQILSNEDTEALENSGQENEAKVDDNPLSDNLPLSNKSLLDIPIGDSEGDAVREIVAEKEEKLTPEIDKEEKDSELSDGQGEAVNKVSDNENVEEDMQRVDEKPDAVAGDAGGDQQGIDAIRATRTEVSQNDHVVLEDVGSIAAGGGVADPDEQPETRNEGVSLDEQTEESDSKATGEEVEGRGGRTADSLSQDSTEDKNTEKDNDDAEELENNSGTLTARTQKSDYEEKIEGDVDLPDGEDPDALESKTRFSARRSEGEEQTSGELAGGRMPGEEENNQAENNREDNDRTEIGLNSDSDNSAKQNDYNEHRDEEDGNNEKFSLRQHEGNPNLHIKGRGERRVSNQGQADAEGEDEQENESEKAQELKEQVEGGEELEIKHESGLLRNSMNDRDLAAQEATILGEGDEEPEMYGIPGTNLKTQADVTKVEETLYCLSHEGKWAYNATPRWLPWDLNPLDKPERPNYQTCDALFAQQSGGVYGSQAERVRARGGDWKVRSALLYEWQTESPRCSFEQFNHKGFCQAVGSRNMAIVGDIFSLDFHDVLLNHLVTPSTRSTSGCLSDGWGKIHDKRCQLQGHQLCTEDGGEQTGFNLRVVLNPFLVPDLGEESWYNNRWLNKLKEWDTGILILNRGSRFRETEVLLKNVRETLTAVRKLYPDLLVIWRNTAGGHPDCHIHWSPLRERMNPKEVHFPMNWHRHSEQNVALQPLLKEFGVVYMDIETATSLRPDGHHTRLDGTVDCHHYCMPGPLDNWASVLYNVLLQLDSQHRKGAGGAGGGGGEASLQVGVAPEYEEGKEEEVAKGNSGVTNGESYVKMEEETADPNAEKKMDELLSKGENLGIERREESAWLGGAASQRHRGKGNETVVKNRAQGIGRGEDEEEEGGTEKTEKKEAEDIEEEDEEEARETVEVDGFVIVKPRRKPGVREEEDAEEEPTPEVSEENTKPRVEEGEGGERGMTGSEETGMAQRSRTGDGEEGRGEEDGDNLRRDRGGEMQPRKERTVEEGETKQIGEEEVEEGQGMESLKKSTRRFGQTEEGEENEQQHDSEEMVEEGTRVPRKERTEKRISATDEEEDQEETREEGEEDNAVNKVTIGDDVPRGVQDRETEGDTGEREMNDREVGSDDALSGEGELKKGSEGVTGTLEQAISGRNRVQNGKEERDDQLVAHTEKDTEKIEEQDDEEKDEEDADEASEKSQSGEKSNVLEIPKEKEIADIVSGNIGAGGDLVSKIPGKKDSEGSVVVGDRGVGEENQNFIEGGGKGGKGGKVEPEKGKSAVDDDEDADDDVDEGDDAEIAIAEQLKKVDLKKEGGDGGSKKEMTSKTTGLVPESNASQTGLQDTEKLLEKHLLSLKAITGYIPGSLVNDLDKVEAIEETLSCFSSSGNWVYNATPRWIPWDLNPLDFPDQPNFHSCDIAHKRNFGVYGEEADKEWKMGSLGKWEVRKELKYQWKTTGSSCHFEQFDRENFCRAIRKRNIVLVGDHTQLQLHDSFLNHLVSDKTKEMAGWLGDARANKTQKTCSMSGHQLCGDVLGGEGFNIRVVRNNLLAPDKAGGGGGANNKWLRNLRRWNTDILILNRGSVYRPMDVFLEQLTETLEKLRTEYPEILVFWRNTPQGHPDCEKFSEPLSSLPKNIKGGNWENFPAQNEAVRKLVKRIGGLYLDVASATSLRPDGHHLRSDGSRDCHVYCSPGPVDHWINIIYNAVRVLNEHEGRGRGRGTAAGRGRGEV